MNLKFVAKGVKGTTLQFKKYGKVITDKHRKGVKLGSIHLMNQVVTNLRTGKYKVKTDTGRLKNSFSVKITGTGTKAKGFVGSPLKYAPIHEFGKKINVSRKMSRFAWRKWYETQDEMWKKIALLKGKQIKIPARYYLRKTMKAAKKDVLKIVKSTVEEVYKV